MKDEHEQSLRNNCVSLQILPFYGITKICIHHSTLKLVTSNAFIETTSRETSRVHQGFTRNVLISKLNNLTMYICNLKCLNRNEALSQPGLKGHRQPGCS
jgi:hypothetical protein